MLHLFLKIMEKWLITYKLSRTIYTDGGEDRKLVDKKEITNIIDKPPQEWWEDFRNWHDCGVWDDCINGV